MKNDIRFSVIMPAYNASKYIRAAVEAVLIQSYKNWQLVIVDDGSTDDTFAIAKEYEEKDELNRIVVVHQENSGTAAAARNTALDYVVGDYVQILDSDDYVSSDLFEKYAEMVNSKQVRPTIISPIMLSVNDNGDVNCEISNASSYVGQVIDGKKAFELSLNWKIHGCVCVDADLLKRIKFDPQLVNGDEFTTRKLFANAEYMMFTCAVYYYRDNLESTTKSIANKCRMFEALITNGNIYKYSISEKMGTSIQALCARKWDKSLIAHEAQFLRDANTYDKTGYQYADEIINRNLEENFQLQVATVDSSVYGVAMRWCGGKKRKLIVLAKLYNVFWRLKK